MPSPSETSALLWSKSSNAVRDQLKKSAGKDGKLQKSEFRMLLLDLGIRIKQAVVEEIFTACDIDGDGGLTIDEIFDYVDSLDASPTTKDAVSYTTKKTTSSIVWWFAVAFHFAAWVGIVSFIDAETGRKLRPEWSLVGAWFFFFGAVYFFKLLLDYETDNYETMIQAKIILKQSVEKDPTCFDTKAGVDARLDPYELNCVLEEQGLYLPKPILKQIFADIDTDNSGRITKDEIVTFAKTQATDPTWEERQAAIQKAVVHTWGFWSLSCWFVGSILFLVGAHLSYAGYTESVNLPKHTYLHLYGMGSVMYFLLAVCMTPSLYSEVRDYLDSIEKMSKAFASRRQSKGITSDAESFRSLTADSEGGLDVMELYQVLIAEGVLIPYDTLLELFRSADTSADGKLQMEEFTNFVKNMQVAKDPWQYHWQMLQRIPFTSSFFGWFMFFIGGIFFTMGSYIDVADSTYWYFAGAVCYGMASGKNVFGTILGHYRHFWAVEEGKAEFKARIAGNGLPDIA